MSKSVKCGWCGLVDPSPHSEVIHRGTLECVDTQACANRLAEADAYNRTQALAAVCSVLAGLDVPSQWDFYGAVQDARAARAEVERLREALAKYGGHLSPCFSAVGCDCGFSAALAGAPSETRREQDRALAEREGRR